MPGCQLWLDAADTNTFTFSSGSNISTWRDKSGNNFTGTAVNSPTQTSNSINGLPAVVFSTGTQYIDYGNILNLGTNGVYIFAVVKYDSTADGAIVGKSRAAAGGGRWALIRQATNGGTLVLGDASSGGVVTAYADTSTTPQLVSGYWDRFYLYIRQNGTQRNSGVLYNIQQPSYSTTDSLFVGAYQSTTGGAPPSAGLYLNGKIGEIIVYITTSVSPLQIQHIEGYLAWKWGLNTSLPDGHTVRLNPLAMRIFQPLDITGLEFWMDASDKSTITPAGITNGQTITAIREKSGNNRTITIDAGTPTYANNTSGYNGAITFNGSTRLGSSITPALGTADCFTAIAIKPTGALRNQYVFAHGGTTNANLGFFYFDSTAFFRATDWAQGLADISNRPTYNSYAILTSRRAQSTQTTRCMQGVNSPGSSISVASGAVSYESRVTIGALVFGGTPQTTVQLIGEIGEILVYRATITSSQQDQIERYLTNKWNMGPTNLITASSYYISKALPSTQLFSPLNFSPLLWLDAADTLGNGVVPANNVSVSTWIDKSGNGRNGTFAGTAGIYQSNSFNTRYPSVFFNFTSYRGALPHVATTLSCFMVANPSTSTASFSRFISLSRSGVTDFSNTSVTAAMTKSSTGNTYRTERTPLGVNYTTSLGFPCITNVTFSGTNCLFYVNGSIVATNASTGTFNLSLYSIGSGVQDAGGAAIGNFCEFIIYGGSFTTPQRQQLEGYLAWKWGLQSSLPATHPYYKFRA